MILPFKDCQAAAQYPKDIMEFSKWALAVLLGAFGAWIGAGAAYFFGKENLQESSISTENALKIQQDGFRRPQAERIKDMILTAMNPEFIFGAKKSKSDVVKMLEKFKGYWFVPIKNDTTAALQDVIHARVFWDNQFQIDDTTLLEQIGTKLDANANWKNLHGDLFYIKVSPDDKIIDVYDRIKGKDAEVAIVVDDQGRATQCLSKSDLSGYLRTTDRGHS